MKIPFVVLIAIAIVCSGCATAKIGPVTGKKYSGFSVWMGTYDPEGAAYLRELRVAEYLRAYPKTNQALRQELLEGKIHVGMTWDQVQASWGPPLMVRSQTVSWFGKSEIWEYYGNWVWMSNGKVDTIQKT